MRSIMKYARQALSVKNKHVLRLLNASLAKMPMYFAQFYP